MKKFALILICLATGACLYYLFLRPYEYEVNLKAKTLPGDLIQTVKIWNHSLVKGQIINIDSLDGLEQVITRDKRVYHFTWSFDVVSDTVTKINVQITEPQRALMNKILIPFSQQPIENDAREIMYNFHKVLREHLEITRVKIIGESNLDSVFCICRTIETKQNEKAYGMMREFVPLTTFISEFNLQVQGYPMVRLSQWNHKVGAVKFDFCFPIKDSVALPQVEPFTYKKFAATRALKAEYFGNYITSDRAWYELTNYAQKGDYDVTGLPVEYFQNNPNLGANEREWKAEIYLPIR